MELRIVAAGKLKEAATRSLVDDYYRRIRRSLPLTEVELRDDARAWQQYDQRSRDPRTLRIALEVQGRALSSAELAHFVQREREQGTRQLDWLIGGADGLPPGLSQAAHHRISLSTFTLPHRLARLLLAEQLYRALCIIHGEPYAH
ncbi:MAG: 23S rRNA (pseudouridine(1915)-N(3))-methyltransferase RlmH [Polyangiales bacterium]